MLWKREYRKDAGRQNRQKVSYEWLDRFSETWKGLIKRLCSKIEKPFNKIQPVYKKAVLVVFFIAGTTLCVFFAIGSRYVKSGSFQKIAPITQPAHALPHNDTAGIFFGTKKYIPSQNLQQYRVFMDSLSSSTRGKVVLDSLRRYRPGLLDSLALVVGR